MSLLDVIGKASDLTIQAYLDSARSRPAGEPGGESTMQIPYNPESISLRHENAFQGAQASPTTSAQARFAHSRSRTLRLTILFEGVDMGPYGLASLLSDKQRTVTENVKLFLLLCQQVNSDSHEPSYLRLIWHKGVVGENFDCRLQSVDINYSCFDTDGSPLHAELAAQFVEDLDPRKRAAQDNLSSPDLTHRRLVHAGDTLPQLCLEIYGTAEHYLRVAEVNNLDDVRVLTPGQQLLFPPYARAGG
ncbi:MAG: hypothetical protein ACKO25_02405 [Cyanobium sp.]